MNTSPQSEIIYSLEFEHERVTRLIERSEWYRNHKYNVRLPGGKRLLEYDGVLNCEKLLEELEQEYNPAMYEDCTKSLREQW